MAVSCLRSFGRCSGFSRIAVIGFEFQLIHRAIAERYIAANLAEILRLDDLSIGSGMAVEVSNFNDLPIAWKCVALRYSHSAHVYHERLGSPGGECPTLRVKQWQA